MTRTKRLILATGLALSLAVPMGGVVAHAAPAAPASPTTAPTTITVREGDSLAGIAWRHRVRLSALLQANSLTITSVIHPGDTLVIPAGATIPTGASTPSRPAAAPTPSTGANVAGTTYQVVAGDALVLIAWRHGVRLSALLAANGLSITSVILPGQTLSIPPATLSIPPTTPSAPPTRGAATASAPAATTPPPPAAPAAPVPLASPPAATASAVETVTSFARAQVGVPYRFFSAGPDAYDCSGLVVAAFRQVGVAMPHQSRALARRGTAVDWRSESIVAGDLVFTSAFNDPDRITHVGIALDSRRWVHAVGPGRTVIIGSLPSSERIMEVRRIPLG